LFEVTSGHCSCAVVIEGAHPSVDDQRARLRARYDGKDWSQRKIARALADWDAAHDRRQESQAAPLRQFRVFLRALASRPAGLRVLVRFYSGHFDTEDVRIAGTASLLANRLGEAGALSEDNLTEILSRAG
jgi:hypothetical protein